MNVWFEQVQEVYLSNNIWSWVVMAILASITALAIKFCCNILSIKLRKLAKKTSSIWDDVGVDIIDGLKTVVIFVWLFFLLTKTLNPSLLIQKTILFALVSLSIFQIGIWGHYLIGNWRDNVLSKKIQNDPSSAAALGLLYTTMQTLFIAVIILIGLSNLGIDIGALIAGLGVGGIAVALAAQNILGDLLASLSIVLDKPFVVGDFIVAGDEKGTIENIGIKTTRIRSLSGEELILSNRDLLESRVHNYKRMSQRRIVQRFGVVYSTPADVLEQIPIWVKTFIEHYEKLNFDRCHLAEYGASSLDFEMVFYVLDPDYNVFMDLQQKVLIDIFRKFGTEGVDFAFPSQSIYIEKMPKSERPIKKLNDE